MHKINSLVAERAIEADALTEAMVGIGMRFATKHRSHNPNIEATLFDASRVAMDGDDFRVLAVLVSWLSVHHSAVNVRQLRRLLVGASVRVCALWQSISQWKLLGPRWRALHGSSPTTSHNRVDLLPTGTEFLLQRHGGEDVRFRESVLRVPAGVLRDRAADVLTPEALARMHAGYRWRLIVGPTHRADLWAALEGDPTLSASELCERARCPLAIAERVVRDQAILRSDEDAHPAPWRF